MQRYREITGGAVVFFPSNAFMASARSFNTFNCMLQIRSHSSLAQTWPSAD